MSDTVIKVENLSKKYIIGHQKQESYTALRDVMANGAKSFARKLFHPFNKSTTQLNDTTEEFYALSDISFAIKQGDRVGIIGRNGAGKSTLLKILSRITEPSSGRISITGRVASLLEVGTGFHPELTGRENIYLNGAILGMSRIEIKSKFDEIVAFAEVERFLDTPVKRYSSGMYVRLAFAVAAHLEPEILIVDEVLAVGDAQFQKKCLGKMEEVGKEGRTVLFVSHNMAAIRALCSNAIILKDGQVFYKGDVEEAVCRYMETVNDEMSFERLWHTPESAPGNEYVRLRRMAIVAHDDSPPENISIRTPVDIEIEFWNYKPDAYLSISMHIITHDDVIAFASTTWQERDWNGKKFSPGFYRCRCQLSGDLLNVGPYRIGLYFIENSTNVLCKIDNALTFQLLDSTHDRGEWHGKWDGVTRPNLKWTTEHLAPLTTEQTHGEDLR